ncbi:Long chain acyl-CoA synthetase 4 [Forsythia ovata]|uniref:Long chain acyl-CoA synthetase 4 n=1 Tax=Forsythia ovata TaxID=205694 RepID=A0ABD1VGD4_9LAMI
MAEKKFIVEIEKAKEAKDGRPSVGPVYRNVLVKDGFRPLAQGLQSCWDMFCESVKNYPNNRMLGEREIINGKLLRLSSVTYTALVSFGNVTVEQKEAAGNFGVKIYSWNDFLLLGLNKQFDIPIKKKTDICTIMYTSGTTGDPKGVMISNDSILSVISGVNLHLESMNEEVK